MALGQASVKDLIQSIHVTHDHAVFLKLEWSFKIYMSALRNMNVHFILGNTGHLLLENGL